MRDIICAATSKVVIRYHSYLYYKLWDVVALETPTNTYHHFLCLCGWSVGPEKGRICTVDN
jgi:hypothetical protein